jgi:beta-lactamase regulating signal transducer with metallopeptidase domain
VGTLLFYHPAVSWATARIRHERELCCDDAAAACGNAIVYARALASLERLRAATPMLAMGSAGGSLQHRIERLAGVRPELQPSMHPERQGSSTVHATHGVGCRSETLRTDTVSGILYGVGSEQVL